MRFREFRSSPFWSGLILLCLALLFPLRSTADGEPEADQVDLLQESIRSLRLEARFDEALPLAGELVSALLLDTTNAAWELVDARVLLTTLEKAASLSRRAQLELALADSLDMAGDEIYYTGDYEKAAAHMERALALRRRHLGREHVDVASSLNKLATFLSPLGRYAESKPLYRESLALRRKLLGDDHPETITGANNLAAQYWRQGNYGEAEPLYYEALEGYQKLFGREHLYSAAITNNIALLKQDQGKLHEAEPLFREAVELWPKALGEGNRYVPQSQNNLASVLKDLGEVAEAESLYEEAIAGWAGQGGEDHPNVARGVHNLGRLLQSVERYEEAAGKFERALTLRTDHFGEQHPLVAATLQSLGELHLETGRYAVAESVLSRAADAYDVARLRAGSGLERSTFQGSPYGALAVARLLAGMPATAWEAVERSRSRSLGDLLLTAGKRGLNPDEFNREDSLSTRLTSLEEELAAFRRAAGQDQSDEADERMAFARERLLSAEVEWSAFRSEMVRRYDVAEGGSYNLERVQEAIDSKTAIIGWLDYKLGKNLNMSWAYVIRSSGDVRWASLSMAGPGICDDPFAMLASYRAGLTGLATPLRIQKNESRSVWMNRFEPISPELSGIENLIVIPSGPMAGIPVETLIGEDDRYLGDKYQLTYAPSATIQTWMAGSRAERIEGNRGPVLLVGDPPFNEDDLAEMNREEGPGFFTMAVALIDQAVFRGALAGSENAIGELPRLPGTKAEVTAIAEIAPSPTVLMGRNASEQELARLNGNGSLSRFETIHIATHALVDDERPERSTLVLSQVDLPDPLESALSGERIFDGRIAAGEVVSNWQLSADLVTLSACETALGKRLRGEGYVGFSYAFLQAGARSLLLSLWQVRDSATALFMRRFYENLWGEYEGSRAGKRAVPMAKAEALQEAKIYLRSYTDREGGRPFDHPHYWGAFVLIGDRE